MSGQLSKEQKDEQIKKVRKFFGAGSQEEINPRVEYFALEDGCYYWWKGNANMPWQPVCVRPKDRMKISGCHFNGWDCELFGDFVGPISPADAQRTQAKLAAPSPPVAALPEEPPEFLRCDVCGWALKADGCRPDNCSMRPMPMPPSDYLIRQYARKLRAAASGLASENQRLKETVLEYATEIVRLGTVTQRRHGHSALRIKDGKVETFDPHPTIEAQVDDGLQPIQTIRFWAHAYGHDMGGGHGMIVKLLTEYADLRSKLGLATK